MMDQAKRQSPPFNSSSKNFLFVCGCPRSGTTALWRLLAGDSRIRIGVERYGNRFYSSEFISPALYEKERFFQNIKGDTFYEDLNCFNSYYQSAHTGYDSAIYFGDKIPKLYKYLDLLKSRFQDCKIIFIARNILDVAASYKARLLDPKDNWKLDVLDAINDWNESIREANRLAEDLLILHYEDLFIDGICLSKIYSYLQLEITDEVITVYQSLLQRSHQLEQLRPRNIPSREIQFILLNSDLAAYRQLFTKEDQSK